MKENYSLPDGFPIALTILGVIFFILTIVFNGSNLGDAMLAGTVLSSFAGLLSLSQVKDME